MVHTVRKTIIPTATAMTSRKNYGTGPCVNGPAVNQHSWDDDDDDDDVKYLRRNGVAFFSYLLSTEYNTDNTIK